MKVYKRIQDDVVTNLWTDENGKDETYSEPSFGDPSTYSITIEDLGDSPKWEQIRSKRDGLLSSCDWTQLADCPLSSDKKALWAIYRQALRDLPDTQTDVNNIIYPTKPS